VTGLLTAAFLAAATLVLLLRQPHCSACPVPAPDGKTLPAKGAAAGRSKAVDPHDAPLFVHELTALLAAGRSPQQLWEDAAAVYNGAGGRGKDGTLSPFADEVIPVLHAAQQGAALGLSVPEILRSAAARPRLRRTRSTFDAGRLWMDLAACLEVAEKTGAPLAQVLHRYALQLESDLDAAAARQVALAGPRATVQLLTWLPLFGLGLGTVLGVDPLRVLLGSPLGLAALGTGAVLMLSGHLWSRALVLRAAAPGGQP
jgi:tight adherence protein B